MRVALVHDWLTGMRGGERVLQELVTLFPDADLYTLIHVPGSISPEIEALPIHTSPLSRLPGIRRHYRLLLPLFPWAIERFRLRGYDRVISTSHAVAKGIRVKPGIPHICYCHTPMRYIWDQADAYFGQGLKRALATPMIKYLQRWDRRSSTRVTQFIANSNHVAERIDRHYGRRARVIYPPVNTELIQPRTEAREEFYLLVGGFVPYKNEHIAIEAFRRMGRQLLVVGDGPSRARLERDAPDNVSFMGRVPDAVLADLYGRCRALIYPQIEDFGIVAVEAQAAGRPVIALGRGGARETVVPYGRENPTGVFFHHRAARSLIEAIEKFEKIEPEFDPKTIRQHAEKFSAARFRQEMLAEIQRD